MRFGEKQAPRYEMEHCAAKIQSRLMQHTMQTYSSACMETHTTMPTTGNLALKNAVKIIHALSKTAPVAAAAYMNASAQYSSFPEYPNAVYVNKSENLTGHGQICSNITADLSPNVPIDMYTTLLRLQRVANNSVVHDWIRDQTGHLGAFAPDINTWSVDIGSLVFERSVITDKEASNTRFVTAVIPVTAPLTPIAGGGLSAMPLCGVFVVEIPVDSNVRVNILHAYEELAQAIGHTWQQLAEMEVPNELRDK